MTPLKMRFSVASQRRDGAVATYQQTPPEHCGDLT